MNKEQFILLLDYLDKIGHKLGVGVGEVWPWFIKQQYIQACYNFILLMIILTMSYFIARFAYKHYDPDDEEIYSIVRSRHNDMCIAILCVLCAACIFFLFAFINAFMDIFNAEYAAFKDIISMITMETVKSD